MKNAWTFRLVAALATGFLGHSATAQTSVSLPSLAGDYCSGWVQPTSVPARRQTTFTIPPEVTSIETLRLRVSGAWTPGLLVCSNPYGGPPDSSAFRPGLSLYLHAATFPGDFLHATVAPDGGPFGGLVATFESCCPPGIVDPNLLLGTEISADFFVDSLLLLICSVPIDACGTVTDVRVEFTGTVPVSDLTWGGIKALYR